MICYFFMSFMWWIKTSYVNSNLHYYHLSLMPAKEYHHRNCYLFYVLIHYYHNKNVRLFALQNGRKGV